MVGSTYVTWLWYIYIYIYIFLQYIILVYIIRLYVRTVNDSKYLYFLVAHLSFVMWSILGSLEPLPLANFGITWCPFFFSPPSFLLFPLSFQLSHYALSAHILKTIHKFLIVHNANIDSTHDSNLSNLFAKKGNIWRSRNLERSHKWKKERKLAMWRAGGKASQTGETASAKVLGQRCAWN